MPTLVDPATEVAVSLGADLLSGQTTATVSGMPAAFKQRAWLAVDPYSTVCEVFRITDVSCSTVTLDHAAATPHSEGAPVTVLEAGVITPQLFGAAGDGATDDKDAFNAALRVIERMGAGEIFLQPGRYLLRETLTLPPVIVLRGVHPAGVKLQFNVAPSSSRPWGDGLLCPGGQQVIDGITIENLNPANDTGVGIDMTSLSGGGPAVVRRCWFDGWREQLVLDGYESTIVDACIFYHNGNGYTTAPGTHLRLARGPGRGRLNVTPDNTNANYIQHCEFFLWNGSPAGSRYIWHEDGYGNTVEKCNFECMAGDFPIYIGGSGTGPTVTAYRGCTFEGGAQYVTVDAPGFVGTQALLMEGNQFSAGGVNPVFHLTANTNGWAIHFDRNSIFGAGPGTGIIKLAGILAYGWSFDGNYWLNATKHFDGAPYSPDGLLSGDGLLGIGTLTPGAVLGINASGAGANNKTFRIFDANNEYYWQDNQGRVQQWKRSDTGATFNIANGETRYQELLAIAAGVAPILPFSDTSRYALLQLPAADEYLYTIEMEAQAHAAASGRYYHRKQRLAVTALGWGPSVVAFASYPDEFEKIVGDGFPALCANLALNPATRKIEVSISSNASDTMRWYVMLRILSRANY